MFQPRFAPVTTANVRERSKIDAVDTSRLLLIISVAAMRFIALRRRAMRKPQGGRIKKQ
jgi:hypothetical protein